MLFISPRSCRPWYSALRTVISDLPMAAMITVATAAALQLVNRIGARPLITAGSLLATGRMVWLSRVTEPSTYTCRPPGPMMLTAAGMGCSSCRSRWSH